MINSGEHFENYISHKDIKIYFDNNKDKTQMKLFTSYYGYITVNGRKTSLQEDYKVEPVEIVLSVENKELCDPFRNMDNLMNGLDEKHNTGLSSDSFKNPELTEWQPLPKDTLTYFDWHVTLTTQNSDIEIDKGIIERLKFFHTMEQAEMNYIKMMEYKFKELGIFEAFDKYNELYNSLSNKYPEEFI